MNDDDRSGVYERRVMMVMKETGLGERGGIKESAGYLGELFWGSRGAL
jgi:hypothetical protein